MWLGVGRQDEERLFGKLARICLEGCRSHEFDGPDEELEVDLLSPRHASSLASGVRDRPAHDC